MQYHTDMTREDLSILWQMVQSGQLTMAEYLKIQREELDD